MSKFSQGASKIKVVFYYLIVFQVRATNCLELHLLLVCGWCVIGEVGKVGGLALK